MTMQKPTDMVEIHGNTYPVREKLRALGGRAVKRGTGWVWLVPAARAAEARAIVGAAAPKSPRCGGVRRQNLCEQCRCRINYGRFCGKCEFSR